MSKRSMILAACVVGAAAAAGADEMPPLKKQPSAQAVVDEHLDALNKCDWARLMAQYPPDVMFILPNGTWVEGREGVGKLFIGFCKEHDAGGLKGLTFIPEKSRTVGDTVNTSWRAEAPWLAEPYRGGDAYVTHDGLMAVQVTTFDADDMKMKK